ncbi:M15 family metallopeptidase [Mucilaginibacter sp.]|jgi:peptidoglycan L-alanyl-D-glutamate endopeptidase CwlK|uniref:M15 family metallopeptidase n=1 Tax=Mucilaginibacter sp. TaxID=1882438 RepID=UPI0035621FC0
METTSIKRLGTLHPAIRDKAIEAYYEAVKLTPIGVHPFITQTTRTFAESDALYAKGRTKPGSIVTNARAGQSYHNYSLALDFMLQIDGKDSWVVDKNWIVVVNVFKSHGFKAGIDFKSFPDAPHFEMTFGLNWREMLRRHNAKEFIEGTNYIKI